jgi:predicted membrane-bound spermidine synthase
MGLASVQLKQTTNWKAFLVAVLVGIIGSAGSTILSVYFAQVVLGLVINCLCVVVGILAGLKIQRNALIQSMKATGMGQGSGRATVVIGPPQKEKPPT